MSEKGVEVKAVFKHFRRPASPFVLANFQMAEESLAEEKPESLDNKHAGGMLFHYQKGRTVWRPLERGGVTICYLLLEGEQVGSGSAVCSKADQFCYRIGRLIAEGRAMKVFVKDLADLSYDFPEEM